MSQMIHWFLYTIDKFLVLYLKTIIIMDYQMMKTKKYRI